MKSIPAGWLDKGADLIQIDDGWVSAIPLTAAASWWTAGIIRSLDLWKRA